MKYMEAQMLKQVKIKKENISQALQIQAILFPEYDATINYLESIDGTTKNEYFLLSDGQSYIGISGIYDYQVHQESAWLGWFGILPVYRRRHYGSEALKKFESLAKKRGYRFARLYTDQENNDIAISFYESNGYSKELYCNPTDLASKQYKILIFSKALFEIEVPKWNNKNIDLTSQINKQKRSLAKHVNVK